jgi:chromodomain-helicase-DNA-binding protein 4
VAPDSDDYSSSKRGRKKKDRADREEKKSSRHHQVPESEQLSVENVPSVDEVCETHDLNDVEIEFTEEHYQNLVTQKMFSSYVRPIIQKENSRAQSTKVSLLVAAKWREFCEQNPNLRDEDPIGGTSNDPEAEQENSAEEPEELEYQPKPSRSRASRGAAKKEESDDNEIDDDDDEPKKRSSARNVAKRGKKQKVPTLKIKFGKKKNQSSDEEKVREYK